MDITITHVITYVTNGGRTCRYSRKKKVATMTKDQAEAYRVMLSGEIMEAETAKHSGDEITVEVYFIHGSINGTILK